MTKEVFDVEDIVEQTNLSKDLVRKKIKENIYVPFNKKNRFLDGGKYLFTDDEFNRIIEENKKIGYTVKQVAKTLGYSESYLRELIKAGKLKANTSNNINGKQKYVFSKENIKSFIDEYGIRNENITYNKEYMWHIFQLLKGPKGYARVVELKRDGSGFVLVEKHKAIRLKEADLLRYDLINIDELGVEKFIPPIKRVGWVEFRFPFPTTLYDTAYSIMDFLFENAGLKNLVIDIVKNEDEKMIHIKSKPVILKGMNEDKNNKEIEFMKSHLISGEVMLHHEGVALKTNYVNVNTEIELDKKDKINELIKENKYDSIKSFVYEAVSEKIEREIEKIADEQKGE